MNRVMGFVFLGSLVFATSPSYAGRKSPLEGQPSVRRRFELRASRFQITPFAGFTVVQDFHNTIMGGGKLQYHLSDWFAIGGAFGGGAAIGTGLKDQILRTLDDANPRGGPPRAMAEQAMNKITWMASAHAELSPFGGKMALFSKAFPNYDIYINLGAGFVNLKNDLAMNPSNCSSSARNEFGCNTGMKIGPSGAAGLRLFFNDWMALNLEYRAIVIQDNPAGRDVNGDRTVNDDDLAWAAKNFITVGLAFFLPARVAISP